jgi:hypothetical protein
MLSAISHRGKLRFVLYKDTMNADKLIDFMRRLGITAKVCSSLRLAISTSASGSAWMVSIWQYSINTIL